MCAICSAYVGAVRPARKNTRGAGIQTTNIGNFDMMPLSASRLATLDDCQRLHGLLVHSGPHSLKHGGVLTEEWQRFQKAHEGVHLEELEKSRDD